MARLLTMPGYVAPPRYVAYEVAVRPDGAWQFSGVLPGDLGADILGTYGDQLLAFAVLYRITGIPGRPQQTFYPLPLEPLQ